MQLFSFFMLAFLITTGAYSQKMLRVNQDQDVTGVNIYRSAQAAHDAASAGDIIYIEPADQDYGTLTVSKPLTIYGNGYFLDVNTEPRADDRSSKMTTINFVAGSEGSTVCGVEISTPDEGGELNIYGVSNITIESCKVDNIEMRMTNIQETAPHDVSNIVVSGNFLVGGVYVSRLFIPEESGRYAAKNVLISNNIFSSTQYSSDLNNAEGNGQGWIVRNNTFLGMGEGDIFLVNAVFENNLCSNMSYLEFGNVVSSFNVSTGDNLPAENGNANNFDLSGVFTGMGSEDAKWMIKASSSLKTAASDGGEVGAFGGREPYVISGIGPIPSILQMLIEGSGSDDVPLHVTTSVKSNN